MYGPISTSGRAIEASVAQMMRNGMPREQAIALARQRMMEGINPDIETMLMQAEQLRQQRPPMPQSTIRDQLNMMTGISSVPMPNYSPNFNGGGIVAFAGPEGSLVQDEMMPPRLTPGQIDIQQQMARQAQNRFNYYRDLAEMKLGDFPEMLEDATPEIKTQVVDEYGNVWQKTAGGRWQMARQAPGAQGFGLSNLRNVDSPMRREIEAWRASQAGGGAGGGGGGIRSVSGATGGAGEGAGGIRAAAATEKPGLFRWGIGTAGALSGLGGITALISDLREKAARQESEAKPLPPVNPYALPADRFSGFREQRGPIATGAINLDKNAVQNVKDSLSSLLSGATFGIFGSREAEREQQRAQEKKPAPAAASTPAAPKPAAQTRTVEKPAMSDLDIMATIEGARAHVAQGMSEDQLFKDEDAKARNDKTGPYSLVFTEGDRIKSERMAELKDSKDRSFGRALVAAGLAMAEQASKGGQPGNEAQKLMAAAVAGLGGFVKAQDTLDTEYKKSKKDFDDLSINLETMRDQAKGQLRGKAWEKYKEYQAQAERARDNMIRLKTASAQLQQTAMLTGVKAENQRQLVGMRMQGQLLTKAYEQASKKPEMMMAEARAAQAKTPKEKAAAQAEIEGLIQREAQMIMSIPSRAAAIQYNAGTGDLDFSAADAIANQALGAGG